MPFEAISGDLIIALDPSKPARMPLEGSERLYLRQSNIITEINALDQLREAVRIHSPDAAMAFVRLPMAVSTYFLFEFHGTPQLNVLDKSKLSQYTTYDDPSMLSRFERGHCGVVSHEVYVSLGIPDASSNKLRDEFIVRRPVVVFENTRHGYKAKRVSVLLQQVKTDGAIVTLEQHDLPRKVVTDVEWALPRYE